MIASWEHYVCVMHTFLYSVWSGQIYSLPGSLPFAVLLMWLENFIALPQTGSKIKFCGDTLPELESGDFFVLGSLGFSKNSEINLAF